MNVLGGRAPDDIKAFQLLSEVADERPISQRELAQRLGIALGLVNSYLRNFVSKGYIRIKNYPQNRYAYLLTPSGIAEKARLAYQHVNYFTSLYTVTRHDYLTLFRELAERGVSRVVFCGVDEVAEIAWLSLQETGLELAGVLDNACPGSTFMGRKVGDITPESLTESSVFIITSLKRVEQMQALLLQSGVGAQAIFSPDKRNQ